MQAANRNEKTIRVKEKGNSKWCSRRAKLAEFAHEKFQTISSNNNIVVKGVTNGDTKSTIPKNIQTSGWFARI